MSIVKIIQTGFITRNVKRFVVEKPEGFSYLPGQAADVSINKPGFQEEIRPFTFTSVNQDPYLEFTIKIYSDHEGVTNELAKLSAGDELILGDVFGTITYQGPGLYLAGGAGITPFIAIFRQLQLDNNLNGNTLLFANRTPEDIILKDELEQLLAERCIHVIAPDYIDSELLQGYINPQNQYYYICGPEKFNAAMVDNLQRSGVASSKIILEK